MPGPGQGRSWLGALAWGSSGRAVAVPTVRSSPTGDARTLTYVPSAGARTIGPASACVAGSPGRPEPDQPGRNQGVGALRLLLHPSRRRQGVRTGHALRGASGVLHQRVLRPLDHLQDDMTKPVGDGGLIHGSDDRDDAGVRRPKLRRPHPGPGWPGVRDRLVRADPAARSRPTAPGASSCTRTACRELVPRPRTGPGDRGDRAGRGPRSPLGHLGRHAGTRR
jgi:hypothetical protein